MRQTFPVRLGGAEEALLTQLRHSGDLRAAERFEVAGLPTRRNEAYHYTDLKSLMRAVPPLAHAANEDAATPAFDGAFRLSMQNGAVPSAAEAPAGVTVGRIEGSVLTERDDILVRLNSALGRESLKLTIAGDVHQVIEIDRRASGEAGHVVDGLQVSVAEGAKATIVEIVSGSDAAHLVNHASHLTIGRGAELVHVVLDVTPRQSTRFGTYEYRLAENVKLRSLVIQAGADLARSQVFVAFAGEGSHADLTGLNLASDGQHLDITLDVTHGVPNTTSQELYKQVARGRSKAVFQGKILVAQDAQKTDGKMMMQGLMLSDEAEILSKPELEIYADDVVCGHGSTCGQIDEDSLFYLLSRGIPRAEAETMLVRGFLEELVDPVENEALKARLSEVVETWLREG